MPHLPTPTPTPFTSLRCLALDTSTQRMEVGLMVGQGAQQRQWLHSADGGALASTTLLPVVFELLRQAQWVLADVDVLVVGRGPGAFTGLRTACAVAQGLAYGVRTPRHPQGLPVLPVDTLMAVAEEGRVQRLAAGDSTPGPWWITAVLDARMGEVYAATYCFERPHVAHAVGVGGPWLLPPAAVLPVLVAQLSQRPFGTQPHAASGLPASHSWAGAVWADAVLAPQLGFDVTQQARCTVAWPTAAALLRLAPALWATGQAVAAAELQPLYVRDKVAQTTAERATAVPPLKSASTSTRAER